MAGFAIYRHCQRCVAPAHPAILKAQQVKVQQAPARNGKIRWLKTRIPMNTGWIIFGLCVLTLIGATLPLLHERRTNHRKKRSTTDRPLNRNEP